MNFAQEIEESLKKVAEGFSFKGKFLVEHPENLEFGDYSTNLALVLAKERKENPRKAGELILEKWEKIGLPEFVERVEMAGAGFLNIWIKFDYLVSELERLLRERDDFGKGERVGKTMVIDYSSPNIAKRFGVGHLRSTNIGQAIYNLYKFWGWKVIGDNHLGDWGTQFGKLIYQIKARSQKEGKSNEEFLKSLTVDDLERLYVEFHKEAQEDPALEEEGRRWFKKLEEGDEEAKKIWRACVEISLKEFEKIYQLLGVEFDVALGESFYQDKMESVLEDCRRRGILKESQGALVVEIPGIKVPAMLVKSDGATTYLLRDLACIKYRKETWKPDLIVYEVGADQSLHFQQLFAVAERLGYGDLNQFVHVPHGLIRFAEGKFSTREGRTIHLEEVLKEAIERAYKLCSEAGVAKDLTEEERKKVAERIGIGAVKYNDLKQNPRTEVVFDWKQILSLQGNSGPYLQYTYARTQSVLVNSGLGSKIGDLEFEDLEISKEEVVLLRLMYRFPEIIEKAAREFSPNLLANFLFELAQKFNLFYDKSKILVEEERLKKFRVGLTAGVGQILKNGLGILGIEALQKM